jgi:hypothetical protein
MVEQHFFVIYLQTGQAILATRRKADAHIPFVLNNTGHCTSRGVKIDPRQRNHQDNTKTRQNIGPNASRQVQLLSFSLFH